MNIVLIGFCACGKSATAYELSERLGMKFVDLDKEIEVRYYLGFGRELHYRDIILQESPEMFFQIEHQALNALRRFKDVVVAPGGGAPLRSENRVVLKQLGVIVYLQAAPEVVFERMRPKGTPLFLRDDPSLDNVRRIWRERHAVYLSIADHVVENSRLTIRQTADRVMAALSDAGEAIPPASGGEEEG